MDMSYEDFLEHHGIKGQKWGVRKYQNDDGSLTPAGRVRYGIGQARDAAVATVKKVASATGAAAKKVAVATGHGVAKVGKATADKVGEVRASRKAEKREKKIREWSTDLEELQKHQTELTDDEYREALNRANMNRQLSDLKKAELDRGLSYLKSAALATGDTLMLANNVSKMITGKSFEDLRKAPSEKDKLDLEMKRLQVRSQEAITQTNESKLRDQEKTESYNAEAKDISLAKAKRAEQTDVWKSKFEAESAKREYNDAVKDWTKKDLDEKLERERVHREAEQIREKVAAENQKKEEQRRNGERLASDNATKKEAEKLGLTKDQADAYVQNRRKSQGYSTTEQYADKLSAAVKKRAEDKANEAAREVRAQLKNSGMSQSRIEWYVEQERKEAYRRALEHDAFDDHDYLEHHGIKGQRWGIRRFQNVDGSLTEEGKLHRQNYISKETEKNNAYYAKYEAKYQKLADKAKSDEERAQYLAMKADATKSKNQVNDYLKNMTFDQILSNEKESRDKAIKTATTAAKVGLMGISMAGGVAGIATGVRAGVAGATMAVSFLSNPDNQAMLVNNAMKYAEMGIRTAVDVKQWMVGVTIDEMAQNIGKYTNPEDFRVVGEAAGKVARSMSEGFSSTSGDAVSKATEKIAVSAVSGATKAVEQHGGDTGMAALKIAANLAKETARTSAEISSDAAVTAQNINDVATLITNAGKIKHSDISDDYLEHHGIKGQKWGVRRFQDYDGHRIGAKQQEVFGGTAATTTVAVPAQVDHHADDNTWKKKGKLAAKIAIDILLLQPHWLVADLAELGKVAVANAKTAKVEKERASNTSIDEKTGLRLKQTTMSEKEDLSRVNPGFNNWNSNTKNNCMLCTTAYDMRRRGYDVKAKTASIGYGYDDVKTWYPKAEVKHVDYKRTGLDVMGLKHGLRNATKSELLKQGDGARGNIMVMWETGGGHSMCYEVTGEKVIIRCPQSNKSWNNASILDHCAKVSYARLDNVDFDPKKIKEAVE